jgi:hypothetical protein
MNDMPHLPSEAEILEQDRIKQERSDERARISYEAKVAQCKAALPNIMNNIFQNLERMREGQKIAFVPEGLSAPICHKLVEDLLASKNITYLKIDYYTSQIFIREGSPLRYPERVYEGPPGRWSDQGPNDHEDPYGRAW